MITHLARKLALGVGTLFTLSIIACGPEPDDEEQGSTESSLIRTYCNPDDLVASCSCEDVYRRYEAQAAICRSANARCTSTTSCDATERVMRTSRHCINARSALARCYRRPTAGLASMIDTQCSRFHACIPKSTACGTDAPVLPDVCR